MEIIDTFSSAMSCYGEAGFSFERWVKYIDSELPGLRETLVSDAKNALESGGADENDYLSVLNNVIQNRELLNVAHK